MTPELMIAISLALIENAIIAYGFFKIGRWYGRRQTKRWREYESR